MEYYIRKFAALISQAVSDHYALSLDPTQMTIERPPRSELGDLACPLFVLSRTLRKNPREISAVLLPVLEKEYEKATCVGPYVNVWLDRHSVADRLLGDITEQGSRYGHNELLKGERVLIEFSSPNTNKPLHLGHLRNNSIGESVSRILTASSAEVQKRNLINDRGVHICKAMLAYAEMGEDRDPVQEGRKPDHFVGDYYVAFARWKDPNKEEKAQKTLQDWEQGDESVLALWKKMRDWALTGMNATYDRTGVHFDRYDFESDTYVVGREEVLRGLSEGIFFEKEDGSIWVDLNDCDLDEKVLLRADKTALYVTQDIGTALYRIGQFPFDRMLYVVASEQVYHFRVLFQVLDKLGHEWARKLEHVSYGMVSLPEGRMKSREGTVVDADQLIDELSQLAAEEISQKDRVKDNVMDVAQKIAIAALNYFLLKPHPSKDISFDPRASVSFAGETGPYLQYTLARIASMEAKKIDRGIAPDLRHLTGDDEWELLKSLSEFPRIVETAAKQLNPSIIANYLFALAKSFSNYYHKYPIIVSDDYVQAESRFVLAQAIRLVLENGMQLLAIPVVYMM